jgi:hypothetical protein
MDVIAVLKGVPESERIVKAIVKYKQGDPHASGFLRGIATVYRTRKERPELLRFLEYVLHG